MPDPIPVITRDRADEPPVYRPLSGLAIAGFGVAAAYAVVLGAVGAVAFVTGSVLFLGLWTLVFPLTAAGLSLAGGWSIRRSEGIRSGAALARWGLRLSLVFGVGYTAFYFGTLAAVWWQAQDFAARWFKLIQEGKTVEAFLLTHDPVQRKHDKPSDPEYMFERYNTLGPEGEKGALTNFQTDEFVRMLQQGGPEADVRALGVKDWEYDKGHYRVRVPFRIATREAVFQVDATLESSDSKELEGRQWRMEWESVHRIKQQAPTEFAERLEGQRAYASQFASRWLTQWSGGNVEAAYLGTLPAAEREPRRREYTARTAAAALAAAAGPWPGVGFAGLAGDPVARVTVFMPGYPAFAAGGLVHAQNFQATRRYRAEIIDSVTRLFHDPAAVRMQPTDARAFPRQPDPAKGPLEMLQGVEMQVVPQGRDGGTPRFRCDAAVLVEGRPAQGGGLAWRVAGVELLAGSLAGKSGGRRSGPPAAR